jgi:putative phosphoserine phosphatase/1-acylglycerol-3-phosphate O-acyltransferase
VTTAQKQGAAFFDVDKTLLPGMSMEMLVATGLLRGKLAGRFAWLPFLREYIRLLPHGPTIARKANKAYLKGTRPDDVRGWAEDLFSGEVLPRLGDRGFKWIAAERARGRAIVLLTGMPDLLMAPLVRTFAPDLAVATLLEVGSDGRLTGRRAGVHPYGRAKLAIARDLAERNGWDLALSSAYGDHASDAYILAGVGEAFAVDPDSRLRRVAEIRGWRIIDEDEQEDGKR